MPEPAVTLKDVARRAGVHSATASRALNPETRLLVSDVTARRVLAAAAELGYRPNTVARSLRTRRSHTIGVLIPDLNNPLFPPIVRGLEDRLDADGYVALIGNTDAHGKNVSFHCGPEGLRLTPTYDLVCMPALDYAQLKETFALAIGDAFTDAELTPFEWASFAFACGLPQRLVAQEARMLSA